MTTIARPTTRNDSHWYDRAGNACFEVIGKTTGKSRPVTIRDARENGWVPSVTTVLKVLAKPALIDWMIEQACLAVLTTPRPAEEPIDAFVERVLHEERVQDQEAKVARERGSELHQAAQDYFQGKQVSPELLRLILPAVEHVACLGQYSDSEFVVVGDGYAGRVDLELVNTESQWLIDFKTTKKLPDKGSWKEHRLQLAAYAAAKEHDQFRRIRTANVYISTTEQGRFAFFENPDPPGDFQNGFVPVLRAWQFMNDFK